MTDPAMPDTEYARGIETGYAIATGKGGKPADECADCLAGRVERLETAGQLTRGLLLLLFAAALLAWQAGWIRLELPVKAA